MTCAKCKAPLPGGAIFCPDCGEPVPAGMPTVQLPTPGPGSGGMASQPAGTPSAGAYPPPQRYQPPPSMPPIQPPQHYGAQQGYPPAGWGQPAIPSQYIAQPQPSYVAPRPTPTQRKSDPLLIVMGVLFILLSLVPLIWILLFGAPYGQWSWLMNFVNSLYYSNRLNGVACALFFLGVPGVILLIKGLRR